MPQVLAFIPLFLAASVPAWAATAVFWAATIAINVGISVGLSYLSSVLFKPKQPKPEDIQTSVKNPTASRVRHYGRAKASGPWVFGESEKGNFHKVIALGTGELDAIEELWADDSIVTVDATGLVNSDGPLKGNLRLETRKGLSTETVYSRLMTAFPEWDASHRGDGVSSLYARQRGVSAEDISKIFPNLTQTLYRVVLRGSKVLNPVSGIVAWSDNAAAIIRDYMSYSDGMRLPASLFTTPMATAGWQAAFNRAAVPIPRKAGGTEPAYRLWGSYAFDERPADVLGRMLQCSDARIIPTPDGGVTLDIGTWEEPTVTIDVDCITGFGELSRGRDILTTANVVSATYLGIAQDYQATDADPWIDEEDVSRRGEIVSDIAANMAPSHGQARRLMKLAAYRAKPSWIGSFQCNLRALAAFGKRFVRISYPLFGINEVFEVLDFRFDIGEGGILSGVTLQVQSMPKKAYEWDAVAEEGTEPISEKTVVDNTIPLPTGFSFGVSRITVGGQQVPFGVITFNAPPSEALKIEGRYKLVSATEWNVIPIGDAATEAQTNALSDGVQYEAQVRHVTITGRQGEWTTPSLKVTPIADPSAPGVVTAVTKTGGVGTVDLGWKSPNSANYVAASIRRNTANVEAGAPVRVEYGPPSTADSWQDTGLAPGTYYYWIRAANASNVESAPVATGPVNVT